MGVIFGLPVVSIFIFIAAGLLLGHLFWYRDTSGLDRRVRELEDELATAGGDSSSQHGELLSLQRSFDEQRDDLERAREEAASLRQENATLEASIELTRDNAALENSDLQRTEEQLQALRDEYDALKAEHEQTLADR
ncbi:hypothetical protein, partial [Stieleria sp.]|uniref:hypothetical protein n=1 Tax=Stieleria sp. TaxID=2795976 RepID=UPI00356673D9